MKYAIVYMKKSDGNPLTYDKLGTDFIVARKFNSLATARSYLYDVDVESVKNDAFLVLLSYGEKKYAGIRESRMVGDASLPNKSMLKKLNHILVEHPYHSLLDLIEFSPERCREFNGAI